MASPRSGEKQASRLLKAASLTIHFGFRFLGFAGAAPRVFWAPVESAGSDRESEEVNSGGTPAAQFGSERAEHYIRERRVWLGEKPTRSERSSCQKSFLFIKHPQSALTRREKYIFPETHKDWAITLTGGLMYLVP